MGYCISFIPYLGRGTNIDPSLGLGGSVLYDLVSLLPKGPRYEIYFDNFCTSLALLKKLKSDDNGGTGATTQNRTQKCPLKSVQAMKTKGRGNFDFKVDADNHIILLRWDDNSIVTMASNVPGGNPVQKAHR